jgi:hypothetical protein
MPPSKNSGPSKRSARPLALAECEPFARGRRRHCYVHPDDPDLCVKVAADAGDERCLREQGRDLRSYRWLRSLGSDSVFDRIPAVEGIVDTDLGEGIVMRLYREGVIGREDAAGRLTALGYAAQNVEELLALATPEQEGEGG